MSDEVTATFVFTDLVGSTALASRVGPDAAEAIREAHFGALRRVVASMGGTEVKNLGDGLMVMFTSARRAVSAGVGMQQAIELHNRRADEPLSIRVGIAAGEAVVEDGDYFGTPVIEAARLCAKCGDDQILVTATVLALVGSGLTHAVRDLGGLELKGLPAPVACAEVLWEPEAIEDVALPGRVSAVLDGAPLGFFGREAELAIIAEIAKDAEAEQQARLVAIAGEPGMGKTTLASWAARELAAQGAVVALGGCAEGLSAPFQPWIETIRELVGGLDEGAVAEHREAHGQVLGAWVPSLADGGGSVPVASSDAANDQLALFAAVIDVLRRAAQDRPVVVVILDDLQWSDAASIQLLRHVLARQVTAPILLLATYRDSDLAAGDPLAGFLADMGHQAHLTRMDLAGFTDTEMIAVMEAAAGHELAGPGIELAHMLRRETRGNPFFTSAMLRHLVDTGTIGQGSSGRMELTSALDEIGLPTSVREVVAHRVDRLGDDSVRVLNVAAVIGMRFDFDLVVDLVDLSEDAVLDVLEEATAAALVEEDRNRPGQFAFVHGLVREALYRDLSGIRRQRLHRRIAEALESRADLTAGDPVLLATHFIAATRPHDVDKAVSYAVQAGDSAMDAFAPADAQRWYRKALELHLGTDDPDVGVRCDLETKLVYAMRRAGDPAHRDLLLETARRVDELDDRERVIAVAFALSEYGEVFTAEDPERRAVVARALDLIDDADIDRRVRLLITLATETDRTEAAERKRLTLAAIELARTSGDDRLWVAAQTLEFLVAGPEDHDRLMEESEKALQVASRLGDRALEFRARLSRIHMLGSAGLTEKRAELIDDTTRFIGDSASPQERHQVRQPLIMLLCYRGQVDEAEQLATDGFAEATAAGIDDAVLRYASQLFVIRAMQGRLDELVDLFVDVARGGEGTPVARAAAAFMLCRIGRVEESMQKFPPTIETLDAMPRDVAWTTSMFCYAEVLSHTGDVEAAAWMYERLLPYGYQFANIFVTTTTALHQSLGLLARLLGRTDDAIRHLRAAIEANRSAGALFWEAESQLDLAECLRVSGDPGDGAEAAELIATATDCAHTYGFVDLERRSDAMA